MPARGLWAAGPAQGRWGGWNQAMGDLPEPNSPPAHRREL